MNTLSRQQLIDRLIPSARGANEESPAAATLAGWAFDQFYAEEAGTLEFEPGYRGVIGAVLDDLMFSDQPNFHLAPTEIAQMIAHLEQAEPADDEDDDEEDDDDSDEDE